MLLFSPTLILTGAGKANFAELTVIVPYFRLCDGDCWHVQRRSVSCFEHASHVTLVQIDEQNADGLDEDEMYNATYGISAPITHLL
jgi:hypothetical protein